jgi:hypothetical protein
MNLFDKIKMKWFLFKRIGFWNLFFLFFDDVKRFFGFYKMIYPIQPEKKNVVSLEFWRNQTPLFLINDRENLQYLKKPSPDLKVELTNILSGKIKFFNDKWIEIGIQDDWLTHPVSGFKYTLKHWSNIEVNKALINDLRFIWEKSRFSYLLTVMRYDYHFQEDHSEFVIDQIINWIDNNPINRGPNWKCGHEISIRLMNWMFLLYFYKNSEALTEEKWNKIQQVIYWSLHHVFSHLSITRKLGRNKKSISQALLLSISELIFPFYFESKKWAKKGRKWFKYEICYQIYDDGSYFQFSMHEQRLVIQMLSYGISLTELHNKPFSKIIYQKAYGALNFLYQFRL